MESVGEILDNLKHIEVSIRCRKCGAVPQLVGKQYSVKCPSCGSLITVTRSYLARLKQKEYKARYGEAYKVNKCNICDDKGFVILEEQVDEELATFGYRCLCQAGQKKELAGWPLVPVAKVEKEINFQNNPMSEPANR